MEPARTRVNLIAGCTGAGKTTLVRSLLAQRPAAERWAVLVNDFGAAGLGEAGDGVRVREVAGGCACCTARAALRTALVALLREARPQRLLIELSARALPRDAAALLREAGIAPAVEQAARLCVLDPGQFADPALGAREDYLEQMVAADVLVINKRDAAPPAAAARLRRAAAALPGRIVVETAHGQVSAALLDAARRAGG
jgi:G3E family GTPase